MTTFQRLPVWRKAHELALDIYRITERFPVEERLSFTPHMRWAAAAVSASIAQGSRVTDAKTLEQQLHRAEQALNELLTYIELSRELGYLIHEQMELLSEQAEAIAELLRGWRVSTTREVSDDVSHTS